MENLYCTIFIVDISQNPEEVETVSSRIQQLIEDHGGVIKRVNPWGKQKLAYPIHNRNYGSYVEIEFTANSHLNIPNTIEQEYRINDRVLRHLTYVVTKKELLQREINAARMKEKAPQTPPREEKPQRPAAKVEDKPDEVDEKVVEKEEEKAPDTEAAQPAIAEESVEEPTEEKVEEPAEESAEEPTEEKVVDENAEASEDEKEKVEVADDKKE